MIHEQSPTHIIEIAKHEAHQRDETGNLVPYTLVDLDRLKSQYHLWKEALPSVKPFYAVKCNPDPAIISMLADLGCGFDCASLGELQQVQSICSTSDIILAHPVKTRECIHYAVSSSVQTMTFDSIDELHKIIETTSEARVILRIRVKGFDSLVNLNTKFGADAETSRMILDSAAQMKVLIHGISFHIGSGVEDCRPMARTLMLTRRLLDYGRRLGHPMETLDIGGGFICHGREPFLKLGSFIERSLRATFGGTGVEIIAEPGRFFVTDVQYAVVRVNHVSRKTTAEDASSSYNVYVNDGIYGSFNYILTEVRDAHGEPLEVRRETMRADIWGPTCCGLDIIEKDRRLTVVEEGDWIIYGSNGAYSNCLATTFNGFALPERMYISNSRVQRSSRENRPISIQIQSKL